MTGKAQFIDGPWSGEHRDMPAGQPAARISVTYLAPGFRAVSGVYFRLTPVERPMRRFADEREVYRWSGESTVPGLEQLPTLADERLMGEARAIRARLLTAGFGYNPVSGRYTLRTGLLVPPRVLPGSREYAGMGVFRDPAVERPGLVLWELGQADGPAAGDLAEDITGRPATGGQQ